MTATIKNPAARYAHPRGLVRILVVSVVWIGAVFSLFAWLMTFGLQVMTLVLIIAILPKLLPLLVSVFLPVPRFAEPDDVTVWGFAKWPWLKVGAVAQLDRWLDEVGDTVMAVADDPLVAVYRQVIPQPKFVLLAKPHLVLGVRVRHARWKVVFNPHS